MPAPDIGNINAIQIEPPFAMSSTGGSGFNAGSVFRCPMEAALRILGWRKKRMSSPLWYGRVIHENAFRPYLEPETITDLAGEAKAKVQEICDSEKLEDVWTDQKGEEHTDTTDVEVRESDRETLPNIAHMQMEVWNEKRYPASDIMACEHKIISDMIDPDTGNVPAEAEGVRLVGRIDLLHHAKKITDLKTTRAALSPYWYEHLDYHRQVSTYRYLVMAAQSVRVDELSCFQLTKHKKIETIQKYAYEVRIEKPIRFSRIFKEYFFALRALRNCAQRKEWNCNWNACQGKWGNCQFLPLCWWDQYDDPKEWEKTLIRKET